VGYTDIKIGIPNPIVIIATILKSSAFAPLITDLYNTKAIMAVHLRIIKKTVYKIEDSPPKLNIKAYA